MVEEQKGWVRGYFPRLAAAVGVEDSEGLAERLFVLAVGATVPDAIRTTIGDA